MTAVNSTDGDQHSAGELIRARDEFRAAYVRLRKAEPESELLNHPGFEYTAVHDIQGYQERVVIMLERTFRVARRKALYPGRDS